MPKPGTDRLASSNADGLTFPQPGTGNTVTLCRAIGTQDDAFSPHYWILGLVTSQPAPATLTVQRQFVSAVPNGSFVVFESVTDGTIFGSATVVSQSQPPTQPPVNGQTVTIIFDQTLPANLTGAAIYVTDPTLRGANNLFDRVTSQEQVFARGISIWGLENVSVLGGFFSHNASAAIDATHQLDPANWMVAPVIDLILAFNVIEDSNYETLNALYNLGGIVSTALSGAGTPMSSSPNQNINLVGNFIQVPGHAGIWIGNTVSPAIVGNDLIDPDNLGPATYANPLLVPYLS